MNSSFYLSLSRKSQAAINLLSGMSTIVILWFYSFKFIAINPTEQPLSFINLIFWLAFGIGNILFGVHLLNDEKKLKIN